MGFFGDVADFFEDVGQFLIDPVSFFWGGIIETVEWLYDAVVVAAEWIHEHLALVISIAALIVILYFAPYLIEFYQTQWVSFADFAATAGSYVTGAELYIASFLEAIHFTTIIALNSVALLISPEYRAFYTQLLGSLGSISAALGKSVDWLPLVFRNARILVLDASAALGREYDIAEIAWLDQVGKFTQRMVDKFEEYRQHPDQLLFDLDNLIIKEVHNIKAKTFQTILGTIDGLAKGAGDIADDVRTLNADFFRLFNDLPSSIRGSISQEIFALSQRIDSTINAVLLPRIGQVNAVVASLAGQHEITRTELIALGQRLKRPGTYLAEVDALPDTERIEQVNTIAEIATRPQRDVNDAIAGALPAVEEDLARVRDALIPETPPPTILTFELRSSGRLVPQKQGARVGWFVGDY